MRWGNDHDLLWLRDFSGSRTGPAVLRLLKGDCKVSSGSAEWYRSGYRTDVDSSETASTVLVLLVSCLLVSCLLSGLRYWRKSLHGYLDLQKSPNDGPYTAYTLYFGILVQKSPNNGPYSAYTLYFGISGHYSWLFWRSRYIKEKDGMPDQTQLQFQQSQARKPEFSFRRSW